METNENLEQVEVYATEKSKATGLIQPVTIDVYGSEYIERIKNGETIVIVDNSAVKTIVNYSMKQWEKNLSILADAGFIDVDEMDKLISAKSIADFPGCATTTNYSYEQKYVVNSNPSDIKTNEPKESKCCISSAFDGDEDPLYPKEILKKISNFTRDNFSISDIFYLAFLNGKNMAIAIDDYKFSFSRIDHSEDYEIKIIDGATPLDPLFSLRHINKENINQDLFDSVIGLIYNTVPKMKSQIETIILKKGD